MAGTFQLEREAQTIIIFISPMQFLYSLGIKSYYYGVKVASLLGNQKARTWLLGRQHWLRDLKENIPKGARPYWFHVASLGEFEQAAPIIEAIKQTTPNQFILLTFFSPSGFEFKKNYPLADYICYLPLDLKQNAKHFIQSVQPQRVFFIKYEFWFNFLTELKARKIRTYLVSGIFRPKQHFFNLYGAWFRKKLDVFTYFFVQNKQSKELLHSIGYSNCIVSGDTRLDRVLNITEEKFNKAALKSFSKDAEVVIFGSSWAKEHEIAIQLYKINPSFKIIIAPHEIEPSNITSTKNRFSTGVKLWSELKEEDNLEKCRILIIDTIGLLSKIYRYGNYAFIGGGYGSGLHNTLEPLAYKLPIFFGPKYTKFQEAVDIIRLKVGNSVNNVEELNQILTHLSINSERYQFIQDTIRTYISSNSGATKKILEHIRNN